MLGAALTVLAAPAAADPFDGAVLAAIEGWYAARSLPPPRRDPALDEAARANSARAAAGALAPAEVRFAMRQAGRVDARVIPFVSVAATPPAAAEAVRDLLERESWAARAMTRLGVGASPPVPAETHRTVTVLLVHRIADVAPPPQQHAGGEIAVRGRCLPPYGRPTVLYTAPDGRVREPAPSATSALGFEVRFRPDQGAGEYRLQVLATGPSGPVVAAAMSVWVGRPAPPGPVHRLVPAASPARSEAEASDRLLTLVNAARARADLPPLTPDPSLTSAARFHAREMLERGFFGHLAPGGQTPADRAAAFGVRAARVLENVSVAADEAQAHADLMASPGHRRNVLDPTVTHVGIGVAQGVRGGRLVVYVAETFAAPN